MADIPPAKCRLCGSYALLRQSHLIPKFVFDWMKVTGAKYFRQPVNANIKRQDGVKRRLLCALCEERFSALETAFARDVFRPVVASNRLVLDYDASLILFLTSLAWRTLAVDLDQGVVPPNFRAELEMAEEEWRGVLQGTCGFERYGRIHMFVTDIALPSGPRINKYLIRHVDATVVASPQTCFVYTKFARFITWAEITGLAGQDFAGTLITNGRGVHRVSDQRIRDRDFGSFLMQRAQLVERLMRENLSSRQKALVSAELDRVGPQFFETDLWKAVAADAGLLPDWTSADVGRNARCPCGSGRKFKHCHGR